MRCVATSGYYRTVVKVFDEIDEEALAEALDDLCDGWDGDNDGYYWCDIVAENEDGYAVPSVDEKEVADVVSRFSDDYSVDMDDVEYNFEYI